MKKKEEFVIEEVIEQMIAALQANCDRLPLGKPRTAVLQLLVPYIMNNIERGESVRKIVSIINKLCYIVNNEDIEAIVAAHTKDAKHDSTKRKRRSKTSDQNIQTNDNDVQITSSELNKDSPGAYELGNENVNGTVRGDQEPAGDANDHYEDVSGGNDRHENDIGEHDPEHKQDTAGGIQGQAGGVQGQHEPEQVPKDDGTFIVDDDDDKIW